MSPSKMAESTSTLYSAKEMYLASLKLWLRWRTRYAKYAPKTSITSAQHNTTQHNQVSTESATARRDGRSAAHTDFGEGESGPPRQRVLHTAGHVRTGHIRRCTPQHSANASQKWQRKATRDKHKLT
jgi:hypothetical protein